MIINPLALATKGYVSNDLSISRAFNGDIDLGGITPDPVIRPTGGATLSLRDDEDILMIINSFLFMVNKWKK